jgi:tripartite-type tricarboxylate transporter receptor subunit TctC
VWGPSGMPADIVKKIAGDINRVLATADMREQFAKASTETLVMTTAEFAQFVRKEIDENGRVIKAAGIQPQ